MCVCAAGKYMNTMPSEVPAGWDAWCEICIHFAPFYTQHNRFTKTGSGQTYGQHSKKDMMRFFPQAGKRRRELRRPVVSDQKSGLYGPADAFGPRAALRPLRCEKRIFSLCGKRIFSLCEKAVRLPRQARDKLQRSADKRKNLVCFWCVSSFAALR